MTCLALRKLQVAIYTVIFQTNPFIVSIIAYFALGISIRRSELSALLICFTAVIFIATDHDAVNSDDDRSGGASGDLHVSKSS